jgi:hypothetical protein
MKALHASLDATADLVVINTRFVSFVGLLHITTVAKHHHLTRAGKFFFKHTQAHILEMSPVNF